MSSTFLKDFIGNYLNVPTAFIQRDEEFLSNFEKQHCFLPHLQQEFSAQAMKLFCKSINKPFFYEMRSILEVCAVLFPLEEEIILVGPYVEKEWDEKHASVLLARHGIPITQLAQYQLYYSRYRISKPSTVLWTCASAVQALDPKSAPYEHRSISALKSNISASGVRDMFDFDRIAKRYSIESELLRFVKSGKPKEALEAYERLSKNWDGTVFAPRDIMYAVAAATGLRTLLRKAAQEGGVHPTILDSLSSAYAQRVFSIKRRADMQSLSSEMIYGYSKAVMEVLRTGYSKTIRKAVDYIELHLAEDLALSSIAEIVGFNPNYLTRAFKSETGMTVTQYIAKKRCEIAEELLVTTSLSVAEISSHVGYYDSNYFVKVFKIYYGSAPTKYRQENGKQW